MEQSKKITIIHGGKLLLNSVYPDKFRKNIERRVRERNIDIVSGDYVDEFPEDGTTVELKTRNGKTIKGVDLVVRTLLFRLRFVLKRHIVIDTSIRFSAECTVGRLAWSGSPVGGRSRKGQAHA